MAMASLSFTQPPLCSYSSPPSPSPLLFDRRLPVASLIRKRSLSLPSCRVTWFPLPFPQTADEGSDSDSDSESGLASASEYLSEEFGGHGVSFKSVGDTCHVAKMVLDNGSTAVLMLPHGLVVSYKVPMWHGERMETLRSFVVEGDAGEGVVRGGMFLDLAFEDEDGFSWRLNTKGWTIRDVRGDPGEFIEVELMNSNQAGMVDVKYVLTLCEQSLTAMVDVSNQRSTPLKMTGTVLSHLNICTPDGAYAVGLEGSNFYERRPVMSEHRINPDDDLKSSRRNSWQVNGKEEDVQEDLEGEETANYKQLTDEMSLIYTSAPRNFTIIDRGRRHSLILGRHGFDEYYVYSPGSRHEEYGNYAYVCVGPTAQLKPIMIGPKQIWEGAHRLSNPNL
ncbi:hypothetical protein MLD38_025931 [Melastoma candidum]|uniref:Uncharacterized protein n=1 Tax=Melastoma candidum TaxID=119954 RepID=A0ACB9NWV7_9MYRT|nr:hypothetical protein MLD38_025931 [Melastoma candidum]